MSEPDPAVRMFRWQPNWLMFLYEITVLVGLFGFGFGLVVAAEWLCGVCHWLIIPAIFLSIIAALLMFFGAMALLIITSLSLIVHISGFATIASIHSESIWISEPPHPDLFIKTVVINYKTIAWVKRERSGRRRDSILIVHGLDFKSEYVTELSQADVEEILAILAERCPAAFKPDPPVGWRPPGCGRRVVAEKYL